jgi:hypothetical protein
MNIGPLRPAPAHSQIRVPRGWISAYAGEFNAGVLGTARSRVGGTQTRHGDWGGNPTTLLTRFAEELSKGARNGRGRKSFDK